MVSLGERVWIIDKIVLEGVRLEFRLDPTIRHLWPLGGCQLRIAKMATNVADQQSVSSRMARVL
jgi:hypothetical protein